MRQISNSEIQTYKRCKRKWYLTYHRRLKLRREDPTGARSIGTRVHACLEVMYSGLSPDADVVLRFHDELVEQDAVDFPDDAETIAKEGDLSHAMVEGYLQWVEETGADEGLHIIAPEAKLRAEVLPGVELQGKIDVRVHREFDNAEMVLDHKTVQEFTTPTKSLHLDEQMKTYLLLERLNNPNARTDGAIYNMLRKVKRTAAAKPPFYERFEVRHNVHVMREFYDRIIHEIAEIVHYGNEIERGDITPYPTPTRNCHWDCDFYGICGLMDDPTTKVENMIELLYVEGDPYARYDTDTITQ